MKKVIVVALYKSISEYYRKHLELIFGDLAEFENYYIENNPDELDFDGDLIVTSSNILYEHIKRLNKNKVETIVMGRTFTKEGFDKIKELDDGREMYFVSNFHEIAVECISKLYELGIKDIRLIPYNPSFSSDENRTDIKTAVIAGDTERIPEFIENTIDIGDRVIDLATAADIGMILQIPKGGLYQILDRYKNEIVYTGYGISQVLSDSEDIKKQLKVILSFTNDSIIAVDLAGYITEYNEASERNFGLQRTTVLGRNLQEIFPEITIQDIIRNRENVTNELVTIKHVTYVVNKYGIYSEDGTLAGIVIFCQKYMEMENQRNRLRSKMIPKGHTARYTMESVLGVSSSIDALKITAAKMAKSASTVLITGESGTGKEVFAQAIHNASSRRKNPFIAINCSALAPSLLESELFGYEEGAFTGAKKGGKLGLFEMAEKGSIFLDEIGEMPYELQAKLLRVLMEKEVMRIGGIHVIKVDVRVIAATNKDLRRLVELGRFREDLYYRINVLPLPLPPLRERKEDIPVLAESFLQEFGIDKEITPGIMRVLTRYDWPGNIRELHNCIEYMYQLSEGSMEISDIPEGIRNAGPSSKACGQALSAEELEILSAVQRFNECGKSAGRKVIHDDLYARGVRRGEQEVRFILKRLEEQGMVEICKGRKGTAITPKGLKFIGNR